MVPMAEGARSLILSALGELGSFRVNPVVWILVMLWGLSPNPAYAQLHHSLSAEGERYVGVLQ